MSAGEECDKALPFIIAAQTNCFNGSITFAKWSAEVYIKSFMCFNASAVLGLFSYSAFTNNNKYNFCQEKLVEVKYESTFNSIPLKRRNVKQLHLPRDILFVLQTLKDATRGQQIEKSEKVTHTPHLSFT